MAIHTELEKLYYQDKLEREDVQINSAEVEINDRKRLKRLKELLPAIDFDEIWNCHYAAYLLQHGENSKEFKLAHEYAKRAVEMGSNVTKWLYAATLDRYLISLGKKQKFGTQFKQKDRKWEMYPVDKTTSDEERKSFGVPPLTQALAIFKKKSGSA